MSDEPRPQTKPFSAFVQEQRRGALHGELSDSLAELVAACREHGKPGSLTVTIAVEPNKDGQTVNVTDAVKLKLPEADRGAALFFADDHGNLTRQNPAQPELPLREVGGGGEREDDSPEVANA